MKEKYNLTYRESSKDLISLLKWIDKEDSKGLVYLLEEIPKKIDFGCGRVCARTLCTEV